MLEYNENYEKARKLFDRITGTFDELNINPTPLNYMVWYEYYKGRHPKLRHEMDAILNDPYGFNDRVGRRLYDEHLKQDDHSSDLDRVFKRLLDAMVKKLTTWTEKLEDSSQQLNKYNDQLSKQLNQEQLREITASVMDTTTALRDQNQFVQQDFAQALNEIQTLRTQLLEARADAMRDELTQIGNRKAFNTSLTEFTEDENAQDLFLILTDIDHFKSFNDRFGHLVGDSVLRYFSKLMQGLQTDKQFICRYGGEEFAILMRESELDEVQQAAEKVRHQLENTHLKHKGRNEPLPTITASFGIAQYRPDEDPELFVKRADDMLYQAKQQGRNCVVSEFDLPSSQDQD